MKNTYLIGILFIVIGLVAGQFLNLNINNQSARTIDSQKSLFNIEILKATQEEIVNDPSSPEREYLCQNTVSGGWQTFNFNSTIDGGFFNYGGTLWSCGAIAGNWA